MSVTGVAEKIYISGYFTVGIDLGQECVCLDIVYVLLNALGRNKFRFFFRKIISRNDKCINGFTS
jgi:hypothetical protein